MLIYRFLTVSRTEGNSYFDGFWSAQLKKKKKGVMPILKAYFAKFAHPDFNLLKKKIKAAL